MRGISSFHFIAHQNHFSSHFKELCCAKSLIDLYNVNHNTDFVSLVANIVWLEVNMCCSSNVLMRTKHTRLILTIPCAVCPAVFFSGTGWLGQSRATPWYALHRQHFALARTVQAWSEASLRSFFASLAVLKHIFKNCLSSSWLYESPWCCVQVLANPNDFARNFAYILSNHSRKHKPEHLCPNIDIYIYMLRLHVITLLLFLLA